MEKILLLVGISLLPILGWLWFFNREHRCKRKFVILSFFAGMCAIIPVKLYERYWDQSIWYLEHINLFQYFSELTTFPQLTKLFAFITASAVVSAMIFVFIAAMMFLLELGSRDNTIEIFRKKTKKILEEPLLFLSVGVLLGIFAYFMAEHLHTKVWFFVVVGMLEEFVKHLIVRFSDDEKIRSIADAVSFSIIVALGFAFIENIIYFMNFDEIFETSAGEIGIFFALRSIFPVLGHICFSAILGYFYGVAHFSDEIYLEESRHKKHPLLQWIHQILLIKGTTLLHQEKMLEGLLFAMGFHAIFNSLLEFELLSWLVPFLVVLFSWVIYTLHRQKCNLFRHTFYSLPSNPS